MIEVTTVKSKRTGDIGKKTKFTDHSPILVGMHLYLVGREIDGKAVVTSLIKKVNRPADNVFEVTTSNGSIYEIRKI